MQNDRPLILIVDDETKIRRLVARNLEDFGYDVVPAADGFKALAYFEEKTSELRPDLILMDVMMPGMDGFECAEKNSSLVGRADHFSLRPKRTGLQDAGV